MTNPNRITARQTLINEDVEVIADKPLLRQDAVIDQLSQYVLDSIVPACCSEGCEVEPDGMCEHDCPSILIALGLI